MNLSELYYNYEQYLIGNLEELPKHYFVKEHKEKNNAIIFALIRYVITNILHWTPSEARYLFTREIETTFLLRPYIDQFLSGVPQNLTSEERTLWIISQVFPSVKYSIERHTISTYDAMLDGSTKRWPTNFFSSDKTGIKRAEICLQYCVDRYLTVIPIPELYKTFSQQTKAMDLLKVYKLDKVCTKLFPSPLEFLHQSLEQKDMFCYSYFSFASNYNQTQKRVKRGELKVE